MHSQLTYLIVKLRQSELICRAEQARLADEARRPRSPSFPRRYVAWVRTARRLRPARLAGVARHADPNPAHECLSCDP
jgi:hypothetical protein